MELRARSKRKEVLAPLATASETAEKKSREGYSTIFHYGTIRYIAIRYLAEYDSLCAHGPGFYLYVTGGFHPCGASSL